MKWECFILATNIKISMCFAHTNLNELVHLKTDSFDKLMHLKTGS